MATTSSPAKIESYDDCRAYEQKFYSLTVATRQLLAQALRVALSPQSDGEGTERTKSEDDSDLEEGLASLSLLRARLVEGCHRQIQTRSIASPELTSFLALIEASALQDELNLLCTAITKQSQDPHHRPALWPEEIRRLLFHLGAMVQVQLAELSPHFAGRRQRRKKVLAGAWRELNEAIESELQRAMTEALADGQLTLPRWSQILEICDCLRECLRVCEETLSCLHHDSFAPKRA